MQSLQTRSFDDDYGEDDDDDDDNGIGTINTTDATAIKLIYSVKSWFEGQWINHNFDSYALRSNDKTKTVLDKPPHKHTESKRIAVSPF